MVAPSYIIAMTIRPVYPEPTGKPGYALYWAYLLVLPLVRNLTHYYPRSLQEQAFKKKIKAILVTMQDSPESGVEWKTRHFCLLIHSKQATASSFLYIGFIAWCQYIRTMTIV